MPATDSLINAGRNLPRASPYRSASNEIAALVDNSAEQPITRREHKPRPVFLRLSVHLSPESLFFFFSTTNGLSVEPQICAIEGGATVPFKSPIRRDQLRN